MQQLKQSRKSSISQADTLKQGNQSVYSFAAESDTQTFYDGFKQQFPQLVKGVNESTEQDDINDGKSFRNKQMSSQQFLFSQQYLTALEEEERALCEDINQLTQLIEKNSLELASKKQRLLNIRSQLTGSTSLSETDVVNASLESEETAGTFFRRENEFSGTCVKSFLGHSQPISDISFQDQHGLLFTSSEDSTVKVWDMSRQIYLNEISEHQGPVNCIQYSNDLLVSGGDDSQLKLYRISLRQSDFGKQQKLMDFTGHFGSIHCLQHNNQTLISGSADNTIKIWDLQIGTCQNTIHLHDEHDLLHHQEFDQIHKSSSDGGLKTISSFASLYSIESFDYYKYKGINSLQFDEQGALISGGHDGIIRIWDLRQKTSSNLNHISIPGHTLPITKVQFHNNIILSSSLDRSIKIWDIRYVSTQIQDGITQSSHSKSIISESQNGIFDFQFDHNILVMASGQNEVKVFKNSMTDDGETIQLKGHKAPVKCVNFVGSKLVTGGDDCTVKLWEI